MGNLKAMLLISAAFLTGTISAQVTKKVCFLGNSYTFYNNMPGLVDSLANHDGNDLIKDQNTPGGYRLNQHATNATSLAKIAGDTWDYVVLQDQSQFPSFPSWQVAQEVYPFAELLCDSIRSANECAIPLFFNTWGRRDGDPQWDSINTFTKMNNRLNFAYTTMADDNSGRLSPVGIAFRHIHDDLNSPIAFNALYTNDGSHPSLIGSYLAACIFYHSIFETTSVGNTFIPNGLSLNQASYLQTVAHHVMTDVDTLALDQTQPVASFSYAIINGSFVFTNTSEHAFEFSWNFGDSNGSSAENPVHTFAQNVSHDVTLIAKYCGRTDTITQTINPLGLSDETNELDWSMYPNPSNGSVVLKGDNTHEIARIYSMTGQLVQEVNQFNVPIQLNLDAGLYIVKWSGSSRTLVIEE